MKEMYKITLELVIDGKSEVLIQEVYDRSEVTVTQESFIDPRHEAGQFEAVGFWDKGHSLQISAIHHSIPKPI